MTAMGIALILVVACSLAVIGATIALVIGKHRTDRREARTRQAADLSTADNSVHADQLIAGIYAASTEDDADARGQLLTIFRQWHTTTDTERVSHLYTLDAGEASRLRDALIKAANDSDPVHRCYAIALGGYPPVALPVPRLAAALNDPDIDVRLSAAASLELIATPAAARHLILALRNEVLPPQRLVERLGHQWAVPSCIAAVKEPIEEGDPDIRPWLARALGLSATAQAVPTLVALARDPNPECRISAIRGLGQCHQSHVTIISTLRDLCGDPDENVRAQAVATLGLVGSASDVPVIAQRLTDSGWYVRNNAAEALALMGKPGLEALRAYSDNSEDPFAVQRAREALQTVDLFGGDS